MLSSGGLVLLLSLTYAYITALILTTITLLFLGVFIAVNSINPSQAKPFFSEFTLLHDGKLYFYQENITYQMLATSRFAFIGCWLDLVEVSDIVSHKKSIKNEGNRLYSKGSKQKTQQLFIFKDSLTRQDFSRMINVIKHLHSR